MAGPHIEDLLGIKALTEMVQTYDEEETPANKFFTSLFEKGEQARPPGDEIRWDEVVYARGLAPIVGPDSPHPRVARTDLKIRTSPLASIKLHTDVSARRLFKQRAPGREVADAATVIRMELKNLRQRIAKSVEKMCARTLFGELVVNKDEFEGSEVEFTVKHDVNKAQRLVSWKDQKNARIQEAEIPALVDAYAKASGLAPETALINLTVEQYLRKNEDIRAFAFGERTNKAFLESKSISPQVLASLQLGGLNWQKSLGYYTNSKGVLTRFFEENRVVLLPGEAELAGILGLALGTSFVPRELWGAEGELGFVEQPAGYCAYSETIKSPAGVRLYAEWTGLPYVKFGKGVLVAEVD